MDRLRGLLEQTAVFTETERAEIGTFILLLEDVPELLRNLVEGELKPLLASPADARVEILGALRDTSRTLERLSKVQALEDASIGFGA